VLPADAPSDACVAIGVAPIEFITVVEAHSDLAGFRGRRRPLQNLVTPIRPQVIVHPAAVDHLSLGRAPQRVMGFCILELCLRVEVGSIVSSVRNG